MLDDTQPISNCDKNAVTIVNHGAAPYGKTEWKFGLKLAIEKSSVGVGDEVKSTRKDGEKIKSIAK